jgi:hypothetical protein
MSRGAFYCLFTASGFAGLIYESLWTHYLKLFLGHAAYAQSLVLVVFMGGMAGGAAICARFSVNRACRRCSSRTTDRKCWRSAIGSRSWRTGACARSAR